MVAITTTPIAQRETDSVTRSHTSSQRSRSPGMSTLPSARFMFSTSAMKKRQMKRIVNPARNTPKKSPAMPRTAEIVSGTEAAVLFAPSSRFPPTPVSPSHESSSDERSWSIVSGSSCRKSLTEPTIGTRNSSARTTTASAAPRTVTVAATPRPQWVFAMTNRTGYSKTSPRKMPMKTIRKMSPMAAKATMSPIAATTMRIVRTGRRSSTRLRS
jgi:hypothetical protein